MLEERSKERGWELWHLSDVSAVYVTLPSFPVGTLLFMIKQCKPVSAFIRSDTMVSSHKF